MSSGFTRRRFIQSSLAGLSVGLAQAQPGSPAGGPVIPPLPEADGPAVAPSAVSLIRGEDRRRNVFQALLEIDDRILPRLRQKRYVVIKPNNVSTVRQLASTHADALRGILDYLEPRFQGKVVIAESAAGNTWDGYENFLYTRIPGEYRSLEVALLDLNQEARYEVHHILNGDMHLTPVRLAARLLDPDAFIINAGVMKTHNVVVATLSVKNMALGAPLHQAPGDTQRWNDKRKYHGGVRQTHFAIFQTAQRMQPYWGVTVIDGFEGMEGNGPSSGNPVASRIAIASTDFIAADRIGVEAMGINPEWLAYLDYCRQAGLGQYELDRIELRGENLAEVRKPYRLHGDIELQLQWQGPMTEIPPKMG